MGGTYLIRERLFDLGNDFDITDETGRRVFHVDGRVLSLRDRLVIEDPAGQEVASVHRQLVGAVQVAMVPPSQNSASSGCATTSTRS